MTTEIERLPPQDLNAERSLLGALLIDADAYWIAADIVSPDDLYREQHRVIYQAVQVLAQRNVRPDAVTVSDELRRAGNLDLAGGPPYIADLINAVPTAFHIEHYADICRRHGTLRRVIQAAGQMVSLAYRPDAETDTVIEEAERLLFQIARRASQSEPRLLVEAIKPVSDSLMETGQDGGLRGIPSGIATLDKLTGGFQRSDLIVIAARPGMGKTAFALQVALQAAAQNQIPVGFFSLEMSSEQIVYRLLAHQAEVDSLRIRDRTLTDDQLDRVVKALIALGEHPILLDDTPGMSIVQLRSKVRRLYMEHEVGLLVVDYLQLLKGAGRRDNRVQEVTEITSTLKEIAREMRLPLIACAQLSRAAEARDNPTPRLSDLRESGSIEQDADIVMFLHEPKSEEHPSAYRPRDVRLTVAKHRNGPTGKVEMQFAGWRGHFKEVEQAQELAV
ncbi:MAG: replicative DNA helicase [Chloroflexi bacterium]|nr:replicative DNA helicase [Chloroflexota bacterium]